MGQIIKAIAIAVFALAALPLLSTSYRQSLKQSWKKGTSGTEEISLYVVKTLASDLINRSHSAFEDNHLEEAFRYINVAVILEPDQALVERGDMYLQQGRLEDVL